MAGASSSDLLRDLCENLQLVTDKLRDDEVQRKADSDFTLPAFWTRMGACVKAVSDSATKLCLAFSDGSPGPGQDCGPLVRGIEGNTLALVSACFALPREQGLSLQRQTRTAVLRVIEGVATLAETLRTPDPGRPKQHFHSTGSVWECCDRFPSLPTDNKCAILHEIQEAQGLVKDALEEIEEAMKSGEDDLADELDGLDLQGGEDPFDGPQSSWTDSDRALIAPCKGLVKAADATLKKVAGAVKANGKCDCAETVSQLDDIGDKSKVLSPAVDDLVSILYPPVNHSVVRQGAERLALSLNSLLDYTRQSHVCSQNEQNVFDFLKKAVDHNLSKIQGLVPSSQDS